MAVPILTVTEFLRGINDALAGVPALVEGEVSGFAVRQERWIFFSLKDSESVVECFMPAWKLKHSIEDGMLVRAAGVPQVYAKTGRFRIIVEALEPAGEGSLRRAFELLKQKLEREGLFAPERKRSIPRFPETIGLIASKDSAAFSDFMRILKNRWGGTSVLLVNVPVQGDAAAEAIVRAFRRLTASSNSEQDGISNLKFQIPNTLVLIRGGGSLEDLQAFNSEAVARAIFASPIPVVVGVGHERDVTIADLVADVRASTPSNAAERIVPDRRDVFNEIEAMVDIIESRLRLTAAGHHNRLERFMHCGAVFAQQRLVLVNNQAATLAARAEGWFQRIGQRLGIAERLIKGLNPSVLLKRGYSISMAGGRVVHDAASLTAGDRLVTRFAVGQAESIVDRVDLSTRST